MTTTLPSPVTEAAALSVAGDGAQRYELGSALIAAGADATVVLVEAGDHGPWQEGVQDAATVVLRGTPVTGLHPRFVSSAELPIHAYARLDGACLPLGRAVATRAETEPPAFAWATLRLERPLDRALLDLVRPVPAPGPTPGVDWVDEVEAVPLRALESFALGWFPARDPARDPAHEQTGEQAGGPARGTAREMPGLGPVPPALEAFHRLARLRPALLEFTDPVLERPRRASGPLGGRLVFAEWHDGGMDWSVPWPPEGPAKADPRVWNTWHGADPYGEPESGVEAEPLSRFLLQFALYEALNSAPYQAWTSDAPAGPLAPLLRLLRPVPLSPHLPAHYAVRFHVGPGLIAGVSGDGPEALVTFGALHRAALTPLADRGFEWRRFDG